MATRKQTELRSATIDGGLGTKSHSMIVHAVLSLKKKKNENQKAELIDWKRQTAELIDWKW